ncbi:22134_t:CDS:2, partial [Gigaspora margarita]
TSSGNDQHPSNALQETSDLLVLDNEQDSLDLNMNNSFTLSQNDIESVNTDTEEIEVQNSASELGNRLEN